MAVTMALSRTSPKKIQLQYAGTYLEDLGNFLPRLELSPIAGSQIVYWH